MGRPLEDSGSAVALVSLTKGVTPASLQPILRSLWHGAIRLRRRASAFLEYLTLWRQLAGGGSYFQWYAKRMDRLARELHERHRRGEYSESIRKWMEQSGADDLAVLKSLGLQPHHSLFEFGCGFMRSARHFVDYLEPGNYVGNDAAAGRIEIGLKAIEELGLTDKRPSVTANTDNSMDWANGRRFDFIWSHAVLCHVPPEDVEEIIGNMPKLMNQSTVAYVTRSEWDANLEIERYGIKDWNHSLAFFQRFMGKYGLECEDVPDSLVGTSYYADNILMKITLKGD